MSTRTLFLVSAILLANATLTAFNVLRVRNISFQGLTPLRHAYLASELPLSLETVLLKFRFGVHYNITDDIEWSTLIPQNHGRVRLGSPQTEFNIGMYADLECLDTIRAVFVAMQDGQSIRSLEAERCLHIIRQSILCTADITLEPAEVSCEGTEECTNAVASGNNVDHKCRNWIQVRRFVDKNQAGWNV